MAKRAGQHHRKQERREGALERLEEAIRVQREVTIPQMHERLRKAQEEPDRTLGPMLREQVREMAEVAVAFEERELERMEREAFELSKLVRRFA